MTVSFFAAALSTWRATHVAVPELYADTVPLAGVVKLSIKAVPEARTADTLGAEREGTGIVIDEKGQILTIGYLLLEAGSVLVVAGDGRVFPASIVGYDHATGFGLVRSAVSCRPLEIGASSTVRELATVLVAAHGGAGGTSRACVVSRRRFTGWWEYMIDGGIFTAPPRFEHSGASRSVIADWREPLTVYETRVAVTPRSIQTRFSITTFPRSYRQIGTPASTRKSARCSKPRGETVPSSNSFAESRYS